MQAQTLTLKNGRKLKAFVGGPLDAPPLVLLHGGGIDSARMTWGLLFDDLAQSHRVYAPNWPGYAGSDLPTEPYTTALLISVLAELIEVWGLETFALAGVSLGGAAATGYTLAIPLRVTRLALVSSYGLQETAPFQLLSWLSLQAPRPLTEVAWGFARLRPLTWFGLGVIYHDPFKVDDAVLEEAKTSHSLDVFYEWLRGEISPNGTHTCYQPRLHEITVPTLVIHGQQDKSIPVKWARLAAANLPTGTLHEIPKCGHWPTRERPETFNPVFLDFMR